VIVIEVKVCGLASLEDARLAARAGADYLGFILAESPRQLSPDQLIKLTAALRKELPPDDCPDLVGVFLNQSLALINRIAGEGQLDYIQLHGWESPEFCRQVSLPVIKSISIRERKSLARISDFEELDRPAAASNSSGKVCRADKKQKSKIPQNNITLNNNIAAYLLDTYYPDKGGGGGKGFNWQLLNDRSLQELSRRKKVFLAGGLSPTNVQSASRQPNITGLDVSSGLEKSPGRKDPGKIRKFFKVLRKNSIKQTGE